MSDLFASLESASGALRAFQTSVDVSQNNVTNASTPGFARQDPVLISQPFELNSGLIGGIRAGTPQDTRNEFAEAAVRQQTSLLGNFSQIQTTLQSIEGVFDVSGNGGIPKALNDLYQAFSGWSSQPDDANQRAVVINTAGQVVSEFQQAAKQLTTAQSFSERNIQLTLDQINQAAVAVRDFNVARAQESGPDPGASANLHATLENLSKLVNIQVLNQADGSATVLLGGQTPLVIGSQVDPLSLSFTSPAGSPFPGAPPVAVIKDSLGNDVTSQISSGGLNGLLSVRNGTLPTLIGSPTQAGDLNTLAKSFADTVNATLAAGSTTLGPPPTPGPPLFVYGAGSNIAASLAVSPTITPGQLAAVDPGPPLVSNGTALKLANLESNPANQINGLSFSQFFSSLASRVGGQISDATSGVQVQTGVVAHVHDLRNQVSGVSLDEEAVRIVELQRSYQAASKIVTVVDELTQTLLGLVQ